ncbi:WD40 repeat-like protein [Agrocybe pediades]|nr:WD40 repeat-like protein [Agrocybe pediades]
MANVGETEGSSAHAPKSGPQGTNVCCHGTGDRRNLVVNLDGTGNQFGDKNTNVVEMYNLIEKGEDSNQLSLYYSGIGTYARPSWTSFNYYKQLSFTHPSVYLLMVAPGREFEKTIMGAYSWLSDNYRDGDRIFLLGFSRGAFQVRALSAMIDKVGLLYKGNNTQIPFAYELYADPLSGLDQVNAVGTSDRNAPMMSKAERFKSAFCHKDVKVHFVGAWDTVSSIGLARKKKLLPGTIDGMKHVCFFRHALALDERRVKFLPEYAYGGTTLPPKHSDLASPPTEENNCVLYSPFLDAFLYAAVFLFSFPWRLSLLSIPCRLVALYLIFQCLKFAQDVVILDSESLPRLTNLQLEPNPTLCPGAFHLARDSSLDLIEEERRSVKSNKALNLDRGGETDDGNSSLKPSHDKASNSETSADEAKGITPQSLEVWFAGTHSDISKPLNYYRGGGNVQNEGMDRSRPPLRWMVHEAGALGLRTKPFTRELSSDEHIEIKESLTGLWKFLEWLPFRRLAFTGENGTREWETYKAHHGAGRVIQPGQKIHSSLTLANGLGKSDGYTPKARLSRTLLSEIKNLKANKDEDFWENLGDEKFRKWLEVDLEQHVENLLRMYISEREAQKEQVLNVLKQIPTWNDGRQALYDVCIKLLCTMGHTNSENVTNGKAAGKPLDNNESHCLLEVVETLLPMSRLGDVKLVGFGDLHSRGLAVLLEDETRKYGAISFLFRFTKTTVQSVLRTTCTPMAIAFSGDGKWLASGHYDGTVCIWDLKDDSQTGKVLGQHSQFVTSVAFSPDSKHLVSSSRDCTIRLWDTKTMQQVGDPWNGHTNQVNCVAFSSDGAKVMSASNDKTLRSWDPERGKEMAVLEGHENWVRSVAFSPDAKHIASGSDDGTVRIWDTCTYQQEGEPLKGHASWIYSVTYSPDGKYVASGSDDKTIRIWNLETNVQVGKPLQGHSNEVNSICFSSNGKLLASGSDDHTIRIWSVETGAQIGDGLCGHGGWVWSVAFSPDGKTLASACGDRTIKIWDVELFSMM